MEVIRSKAPARVSFGSTDSPSYLEMRGWGAGVNAAIGLHSETRVQNGHERLYVGASRVWGLEGELKDLVYDNQVDRSFDLAKAALKTLGQSASNPWRVDLYSTVPPQSGLGGSSSVAVSLIGAMAAALGRYLTKEEAAKLAVQAERKELRREGGTQDQYAAAFGGFNFYTFRPGHVEVEPLRIDEDLVFDIKQRVILAKVPRNKNADEIEMQKKKALEASPNEKIAYNDKIRALMPSMKRCLVGGDLDELGMLLDQTWELKRNLGGGVTNDVVDSVYLAAKQAGADGGRLLGAGSGGHMLLYSKDRIGDVERALAKIPVETRSFEFDMQGLVVKSNGNGKH